MEGTGLATARGGEVMVFEVAGEKGGKEGKGRGGHRTSRACDRCHVKKQRCDAQQPACKHCMSVNEPCTYTREVRKRGPPRGSHPSRNNKPQDAPCDDNAQPPKRARKDTATSAAASAHSASRFAHGPVFDPWIQHPSNPSHPNPYPYPDSAPFPSVAGPYAQYTVRHSGYQYSWTEQQTYGTYQGWPAGPGQHGQHSPPEPDSTHAHHGWPVPGAPPYPVPVTGAGAPYPPYSQGSYPPYPRPDPYASYPPYAPYPPYPPRSHEGVHGRDSTLAGGKGHYAPFGTYGAGMFGEGQEHMEVEMDKGVSGGDVDGADTRAEAVRGTDGTGSGGSGDVSSAHKCTPSPPSHSGLHSLSESALGLTTLSSAATTPRPSPRSGLDALLTSALGLMADGARDGEGEVEVGGRRGGGHGVGVKVEEVRVKNEAPGSGHVGELRDGHMGGGGGGDGEGRRVNRSGGGGEGGNSKCATEKEKANGDENVRYVEKGMDGGVDVTDTFKLNSPS